MKSLVFTFGNMNNVCIFAMLNIFTTLTNASGACIFMRAFFMLVLKISRYYYTPVANCNGMSAFVRNVLSSGKGGNTSFLLFMLNNNPNNQHQVNNSSLMATLIHDTDRMSSLEIAELTGKRHDAILRDIRNLLKQGVSHHNFVETSYKQPQPRGGYKELPCFELTKKGCLILASGYFEMKEKFIERNNHPGFVVTKVLVTQKGLAYLNHLFGGKPSDGKLAKIV